MTITPEYRLLVGVASPRELDPTRLPSPDTLDWRELMLLAAHQRLEPLLQLALKPLDETVPREWRERLKSQRQLTSARELAARGQLREVAQALDDAGIRMVALKGAALIECVYREPGLRPMVDLDVLVRGDRLEAAEAALRSAGYLPQPDKLPPPPGSAGAFKHDVPLIHPDRRMPVELHRRVFDRETGTFSDRLFERASPSPHGPYLIPDPVDMIVHLGTHFTFDRRLIGPAALGQLADLAHVIDSRQVDWTALVDRAREHALSDAVFVALGCVDQLELADVPADPLDQLKPRSLNHSMWERLLSERVFVAPERPVGVEVPPTIRQFLAPGRSYMRARYGLPDAHLPRLYLERARVAASLIPPGRIALDRWLDRALDGAE